MLEKGPDVPSFFFLNSFCSCHHCLYKYVIGKEMSAVNLMNASFFKYYGLNVERYFKHYLTFSVCKLCDHCQQFRLLHYFFFESLEVSYFLNAGDNE